MTLWRGVGQRLPRTVLPLLGAVLGIVLLLAAGMGARGGSVETDTAEDAEAQAYVEALERKIEEFCTEVEGVGRVSVTVSLESGWRRVYGKESGSYLSVASLGGGNTVCLSEEPPVIGGIAVVCDGGGDPAVRLRLVNLLRAAYGIGSNKIYIAPSQNQHIPHSAG